MLTLSKIDLGIKPTLDPLQDLSERLAQQYEQFEPIINGYTDLDGVVHQKWSRDRIVGTVGVLDCLMEAICQQNGLANYRTKAKVQNIELEIVEHIHATLFECTAAIEGIQKRLKINQQNGGGGCTSSNFVQATLKFLEEQGITQRHHREYKGPIADEFGNIYWDPPARFVNCDLAKLAHLFQILWRIKIDRDIEIEDNKKSIDRIIRNNARRAPEMPLPDHCHWWAQKFIEAVLGISVNASVEDYATAAPSPEKSTEILSGKLFRLEDRLRGLDAVTEQFDRFGMAVERAIELQGVWCRRVLERYDDFVRGVFFKQASGVPG